MKDKGNHAVNATLVILAISACFLMMPGNASEPPGKPASTQAVPPKPKGMVQVDLSLGHADLAQVKALLPDLLSKDSRHVILNSKRIVRVIDYSTNIEALRTFLKAMDATPRNVRIEVTHRSMNQSQTSGARVSGQVITPIGNRNLVNVRPGNTPGVIRRVTTPGTNNRLPVQGTNQARIILPNKGSINVDVLNQRGTSDRLDRVFTLVRSGSEGVIEVVREVPMVDYFTRYIVGNVANFNFRGPGDINGQFVAGGTFEVPEFRWEKAGSQLVVRPTVQGNLITVEVMPRFKAIVIANPGKLAERKLNDYLTGEDQYVTLTALRTTVIVQSGQTVTIGSFPAATAEFNHRFWGGGFKSTGSGGGSITLKATIQ